jgi:gp16 family phage-associated protein
MAQPAISTSALRQAFEDAGVCVSDWADSHGFARASVYAVLHGRTKGRRGEAHRIAVALGLKSAQSLSLTHPQSALPGQTDDEEAGTSREGAPMS